AMEADVPAKYLNSPDTPLFHKGRVVYNHHLARKAAHDRGTVIAVEGYVDVIAMTRAGFPNAVAPLGTALTEDQLGLLWRMADEPILCFDGDKAGRRAAYRAIDVAMPLLQAGKSLRFALLPEGQDPDDLYRQAGPGAIDSVLQAARPLVDLLWLRETEAAPMDTPERRAAFEQRLREALKTVQDETVRRHYQAEMQSRLTALFPVQQGYQRGSFRQRNQGEGGRGFPARNPSARAPLRASMALAGSALFAQKPAVSPREALLLCLLSRHPDVLERHVDEIADLHFAGREAEKIRRGLVDAVASGADADQIPAMLQRIGLAAQIARLESLVRPGDRWTLDPEADPFRVADSLRQALALHRRSITLHSDMRAAERDLARDGDEAALERIREIKHELAALDGAEADIDDVLNGTLAKKN
ncbi:MAG: toprim domain-containing protein, partial [Beijerinckiaceae bacterium]